MVLDAADVNIMTSASRASTDSTRARRPQQVHGRRHDQLTPHQGCHDRRIPSETSPSLDARLFDDALEITGVAESARPGPAISRSSSIRYESYLADTGATAVLVAASRLPDRPARRRRPVRRVPALREDLPPGAPAPAGRRAPERVRRARRDARQGRRSALRGDRGRRDARDGAVVMAGAATSATARSSAPTSTCIPGGRSRGACWATAW